MAFGIGKESKTSPPKESPPRHMSGASAGDSQGTPESLSATQDSPLAVEEGNEDDDEDSTFGGDDDASSTHSMHSDIMNFREENGRTYHSYKEHVNYVLPNDAQEQERLNLQHNLFQLTFGGKLYLCPAGQYTPITRCLDVGTGTGIWAIKFADENPHCEVIGTDLSPIQPDFVPANLHFQITDIEDSWSFDQPFDFIFSRMLTGSMSSWPYFFSQSLQHLRPGGWIEVQDIGFPVQCDDDSLTEDSYLWQWSEYIIAASEALGRSARGPDSYESNMKAAGLINVTEMRYRWPTNRWPAHPHYKNLGYWCYQNIAGGLSGLSMALFTRGLGWKPADVETFLVKVREDMHNRNIHAWWPIHVVYGQRPPGNS